MPYRIKPKPGAKLRLPDQPDKRLPEEGIVVEKLDPFWKRRELEGGVTVEKIATQPAAPASEG